MQPCAVAAAVIGLAGLQAQSPQQAQAGMIHVDLTAAQLDAFCVPSREGDMIQMMNNHLCAGYLSGASDGLHFASAYHERPMPYCIPASATRGDRIELFRAYLAAAPVMRDRPAAGVVMLALRHAFPCSDATRR